MKKYKYVLWTAVALFLLFIDMIPGFDTEIRGIPLWQYVGFLSYLILAFILA